MSRQTWFIALILLVFTTAMLPAQQPPGAQRPPGVQQPPVAQQPLGAPQWFPLAPEHDKHLTGVLKFWEHQAAQIQRYRCQFTRWEVDPVVLPKYPEITTSWAQGTIQFASPDKGLFKVEKLRQVVIQQQGNTAVPVLKEGQPQYSEPKEILGEHWICDGKSTFQFDALNKQLIKRELPPEMQGKQIAEGPLPFLFGAKAQVIKDRYWIRVKSPPPKPKHFWLEAIPKRREEAADYRQVDVVIDEQEFLPVALILFEPNGGKTTYEFAKREKNWSMIPDGLIPWQRQFYAPAVPAGWQQVNERFQADPVPAGPVAKAPLIGPPLPRQTQAKPNGPTRR